MLATLRALLSPALFMGLRVVTCLFGLGELGEVSDTAEQTDMPTTENDIYLGVAKLRGISTWQLCNMDKDTWHQRKTDPDCERYNSHPLYTTRLNILAHDPGTNFFFDGQDAETPFETKIDRHEQLAYLAVIEFIFRVPALAKNQRVDDICVDMPRMTTSMADILTWYDLFEEWDRMLSIKLSWKRLVFGGHLNRLKSIQDRIRRQIRVIDGIFEVRGGTAFKNMLAAYEKECGESKARSAEN